MRLKLNASIRYLSWKKYSVQLVKLFYIFFFIKALYLNLGNTIRLKKNKKNTVTLTSFIEEKFEVNHLLSPQPVQYQTMTPDMLANRHAELYA